ncbi:odorant receptor Or2-like [Ctenocephalides felis]|uniref:odorant receptor Or2-like n=1 Tax=Ctenocephalides felis TaxID=7515 RepID=UPI000E6E1287|nr:odorant receptor Or2-like [Ctenocephalides felis]
MVVANNMLVLLTRIIVFLEASMVIQNKIRRSTSAIIDKGLMETQNTVCSHRSPHSTLTDSVDVDSGFSTGITTGINRMISIPLNLDFLIIILILCAELFVIMLMPFGLEMCITWGYIGTMFTIFFMYYWHANNILVESNSICDSAFSSNWIDLDPSCKRAIQLMIQRSQKALMMRAFFQPMNLRTVILILRTAYSALALLRHLHEGS